MIKSWIAVDLAGNFSYTCTMSWDFRGVGIGLHFKFSRIEL